VKAVLHTHYGSPDLLELREVGKPIPKANEVLIAIHATTVSTGDCNVRNFTFVTKSMRRSRNSCLVWESRGKNVFSGPSWRGRSKERVKTLRDSRRVIESLRRPAWRAADTLSTHAFLKRALW